MSEYKHTRCIEIGGSGITRSIKIGGDVPVSIQTMWKSSLHGADPGSIIHDLDVLASLGCDLVRFAVPDQESAAFLANLAAKTTMPLVADIHFDYRLALTCLEGPVAKIRINPGNIGSTEKVRAVVERARERNAAIRIGVNSGSLPADLRETVEKSREADDAAHCAHVRAQALVQTAEREAAVFDQLNFQRVIVSMKASSVNETVAANRSFALRNDIPLHIGVTEAGPLIPGVVRSAIAFSRLLEDNIGSTIRVSLSDSMENEVIAGREILAVCGKRPGGVNIVSCPRCGRNGFDVHGFVNRWQSELLALNRDITVAVMGCVVNGPGEGKHADIGITGAGDKVIIFRQGQVVRTIDTASDTGAADRAFQEELEKL